MATRNYKKETLTTKVDHEQVKNVLLVNKARRMAMKAGLVRKGRW